MPLEMRCPGNKVYGLLIEPAVGGVVEVKCNSRWCGANAGVVVLHQFSTETAACTTKRFKEPRREHK